MNGAFGQHHAHTPIEGTAKQALEIGRTRLLVAGALFSLAFTVIAFRLADLTLIKPSGEPRFTETKHTPAFAAGRADIVDRNGVLLATSLNTASLYANPHQILDAREAADKIARALPGLSAAEMLGKLTSDRAFVWIKRHLTPDQQYAVNAAGIPGLYFQNEERRIYPQGSLFAHVLGFCGTDGGGLAGVEKSFDDTLRSSTTPLRLSVDVRVQHILREEVENAFTTFHAKGAVGIVMNVHNGEILAMVSLPTFDPNHPGAITPDAAFNRDTLAVYEMGSTFKIFTLAMGLDTGTVKMTSGYDATHPIRIAHFTISDFHAKKRWLSVPEIFMYSSNIGAAKMAVDVGTPDQQKYLRRFGLLTPASVEIPAIGTPLLPSPWRKINTMTVAFGQGIAVSPLAVVQATAAVVNGGILHHATLLKSLSGEPPLGKRVISRKTSLEMRRLMRLVVTNGTGKYAEAKGYLVGGKTGTAEKSGDHGYRTKSLVSSFMAAFPMNHPQYVVLVLLDEPHGTAHTYGYATGGWVAAPAVKRFVTRAGPLLGVKPQNENDPAIVQAMHVDIPMAPKRRRGNQVAAN